MNVLVVAPHMDDEVLGCGGTIVRHVAAGHHVTACVVANRAYDHEYVPALIEREKEACRKAQRVLGYQELLFLDLLDEKLDVSQIEVIVPIERVVQQVRPDILYLPHRGDYHQDHRAVFEAVRVICRPNAAPHVGTLRVYENPSSGDHVCAFGEWRFQPSLYVDIARALDRKIEAMACYEAESREYPHPRSPEGIRTTAKRRGMDADMAVAEAFMILRDEW